MFVRAEEIGWAVIEKVSWAIGDASVPVPGGVYDTGQGRNRWTVRSRNQNKNINSYQLSMDQEHSMKTAVNKRQ